jgi:hypothetical protein
MSDMLENYSLDFKGKKNGKKEYDLKFKVAKGVNVTYKQANNIHEIHLKYEATAPGTSNHKNYKVTGSLNVQFFQYVEVGLAKDGSPPPPPVKDPKIIIEP